MKDMKAYLIAGYIVIAVIVSLYFNSCSNPENKPYSYNLGKAAVWPISVLVFHGR